MAPVTLIIDASVGVKWFSSTDEDNLTHALAIRDQHVQSNITILIPDLFYYEVANALIYKQSIPFKEIQIALNDLFDLGLQIINVEPELIFDTAKMAREFNISVYDAIYAVAALKYACPLVTANPRHQGKGRQLGCQVISLKDWKGIN